MRNFLTFIIAICFSSLSLSQDVVKVQTVIAEGIGSNPDSALQNAAQNALTNVVGSFMDSNKVLEKRIQIKDGIKNQITNIKNDIKEYSQGTIKNIEILESNSDGGLYRVTAKISVKVEDFKVYIKNLAEAESSVDAGVIANIAIKNSQTKSLSSIVDEIINPLALAEVYELKIMNFMPLSEMGQFQGRRGNYNVNITAGSILQSFESLNRNTSTDANDIIFSDIEISLKSSFKESFLKTLESIAVKKLGMGSYQERSPFVIGDVFNLMPSVRDGISSVLTVKSDNQIKAYELKIGKNDFNSKSSLVVFNGTRLNYIPEINGKRIPKLQLNFHDGLGEQLSVHELNYPYDARAGSRFFIIRGEMPLLGSDGLGAQTFSAGLPLINLDKNKFRIFILLGDQEKKAKKINIKFVGD